ncbi:MAG: protein kinase [Bradymonadales bacterium]|nr:protein kinase [Bradymonadales bacterium]
MQSSTQLGKYSLKRKLATGGMAEIWLSEQRGPGGFAKELVIKRILPHLASDQKFVQMFLDEARLAAQLTHPNIVQIYDLGEIEGSYFIAMEYVRGRDLDNITELARARGEAVSPVMAARIVSDACGALDYAHSFRDSSGIHLRLVHRDISPQNILVSEDGVVKLVDFGVAKAATSVHKTQTGAVKGKFCYMSPEQIGGEELDGRSDLFAMGIVLYELVTGRRPFGHDSELAAITAIVHHEPAPPRELIGNLPPVLEGIILRALQKDRNKRYPTADAMQTDLEAFLSESGTVIRSKELAAYLSGMRTGKSHPPAMVSHEGVAFAETLMEVTPERILHAVGPSATPPSRMEPTGTPPPLPPLRQTRRPTASQPQRETPTPAAGQQASERQLVVSPAAMDTTQPLPPQLPEQTEKSTPPAKTREEKVGVGLVLLLVGILALLAASGYYLVTLLADREKQDGLLAEDSGSIIPAEPGDATPTTLAQLVEPDAAPLVEHPGTLEDAGTEDLPPSTPTEPDMGPGLLPDIGLADVAPIKPFPVPAGPQDAGVPEGLSVISPPIDLDALPEIDDLDAVPEPAVTLDMVEEAVEPAADVEPDAGAPPVEPAADVEPDAGALPFPPAADVEPDAGALPFPPAADVEPDAGAPPVEPAADVEPDADALPFPPAADVEPDAGTPPVETAADVQPSPEDADTADQDVRAATDRRSERTRRDRSTAPPEEESEPGIISISVSPPGRYDFYIDEEHVGRGTSLRHRVSPGSHRLVVSPMGGSERREQMVEVRSAATVRVSIDFRD